MSEEEFKKECDNLYQRFRERGYPKKPLRKAFLRAKATPRNALLENKPPPPPSNTIRCIGTYDVLAQEIQMILRKHWNILKADQDLTTVLPSYPNITYRRGKNLREMLVHSHLRTTTPTGSDWLRSPVIGSFPCGGCTFCQYLPKKKSFTNPPDGKQYTIKQVGLCTVPPVPAEKSTLGKPPRNLGEGSPNI